MKKRERVVIMGVSAFIFAVLFYHQSIGLNFGLLGLIIWGIAHFRFKHTQRNGNYWLLSFYVLITSFGQMYYGDEYSFFALLFALFTFDFYVQYRRLNILFYPLTLLANYTVFPFRFLSLNWLPTKKIGNKKWFFKLMAFIAFPLFISILFLLVYATGSDALAHFIENFQINLNIFHFLGLFLLGIFFFFNFWLLFVPRNFVKFNQNMRADFTEEQKHKQPASNALVDIDTQRTSGIITLSLLCVTLLVFVVIYTYEQFFSVKSESLSSETHTRVNTIIFSIILAMTVILFYFKSYFNFDPKAKILKQLSYLWLVLNSALVFSAFFKTTEYVLNYGLTFKRIGVLVFLTLCLVGLFYAYVKISQQKTNIFLITKMIWIFYSTFVVLSVVNFSWIVTKYNLTFQKEVDYHYLNGLQYNRNLLHGNKEIEQELGDFYDFGAWEQKQESKKPFLSQRVYYWFVH